MGVYLQALGCELCSVFAQSPSPEAWYTVVWVKLRDLVAAAGTHLQTGKERLGLEIQLGSRQ